MYQTYYLIKKLYCYQIENPKQENSLQMEKENNLTYEKEAT